MYLQKKKRNCKPWDLYRHEPMHYQHVMIWMGLKGNCWPREAPQGWQIYQCCEHESIRFNMLKCRETYNTKKKFDCIVHIANSNMPQVLNT